MRSNALNEREIRPNNLVVGVPFSKFELPCVHELGTFCSFWAQQSYDLEGSKYSFQQFMLIIFSFCCIAVRLESSRQLKKNTTRIEYEISFYRVNSSANE